MKWIKHDTDANRDAKLIKVRMKYGLEGYGLYWFLLELIAAEISENNLTFELEHDAEIIAHQTGIHYQRVQEMMIYMVNLGLFEDTGGTITCLKLLKRLDQSMTSNPRMRKFVTAAKNHHDPVMTPSGLSHDNVMQEVEEEVEVDKTNIYMASGISNSSTFSRPSLEDVAGAMKLAGYGTLDPELFFAHYESLGWKTASGGPIEDWRSRLTVWAKTEAGRVKQGARHPSQPKETPAQRMRRELEESERVIQ